MLKVTWVDNHREPKCPPDPVYPEGIDIDLAKGAPRCQTPLPYPAKRCGAYIIECQDCGGRFVITTAGRPDDPRSVKVPCKRTGVK